MEALEEIRDRIQWFCGQVPGKWNPPWAQEIYEIACLALVDEWVKKANETKTTNDKQQGEKTKWW